jgi:hypothetical protein
MYEKLKTASLKGMYAIEIYIDGSETEVDVATVDLYMCIIT